jgi:type IV pilus assembly protein PilQ
VVALISATVKASFVVPDHVGGKVTIRVKNVPWEQALETVLASHGLWYRYRAEAKIVRIAPRKELDAEVEAALKRQHLP